jgi:hypothetical protein
MELGGFFINSERIVRRVLGNILSPRVFVEELRGQTSMRRDELE